MHKLFFLSIMMFGLYMKAAAQIITTIAGTPHLPDFSGDGGPATHALMNGPASIAFDRHQNLYISDHGNNRIRKITPAGIISTIAGSTSTLGFAGDGGPALQAVFGGPRGLAIDSAGNIYISDISNSRIRRIDAQSGIITTIAGNGTAGYSGDGGPATAAQISVVHNLTLDRHGNLYFAEEGNHRVRRIDAQTGIITTVAGSGTAGYNGDSISAVSAHLYRPRCVVVDSLGSLFIADTYNHIIRKVTPQGMIYNVAGMAPPAPVGPTSPPGDGGPALQASLYVPEVIALDRYGRLYIGVAIHRLRMVDTNGIITTIAGDGQWGHSGDGGPASQAQLVTVYGIAFDNDERLYFADYWGQVIRKIGVGGTYVAAHAAVPQQLGVYPNPGSGRFYISGLEGSNGLHTAEVWSLDGRLLQRQPLPAGQAALELGGHFAAGTYLLRITEAAGAPIGSSLLQLQR